MKLDQIAIHDATGLPLKKFYDSLGANSWADDIVISKGIILFDDTYHKTENTAHLSFNYNLFPMEFELINYIEGDNFLRFTTYGTISHFGSHVNSIHVWREFMKVRDFTLVQEVITQSHTSDKVHPNRRYHYAIYRHPKTKLCLKLIERIIIEQIDQELEKIYDLL